ncbi:energy-coupling factor ABC transporter ATP-binding protein [Corynebacterium sanguinis]|uniref:ABC transporter ATP-binding protein n=1 Tax=Corynebacterium sanguinis TaxID=2594913 RepID=UPI0021A376CC|nr:ABC transporter ATP-binding protein [Corynebacterium sanguinis]MCT1882796.1 energy-coupling factor ABC transporter ATP-binding protein [Corynebacterium sanguinis]
MAAILARELGYKHATRAEPAFAGVDLTVERGERILISGNSGSGKSTLLAVIAGLAADGDDGHSMGSVTVDGTVGMVMQDPESQTILSRVGDDVAFGAENIAVPAAQIWPRVRWALDAVGLDVELDHSTARLSGGQKQRLALAGVLAMGADIIILDEPTANLDPKGRDEIIRAVDKVCAQTGATLVVVEHRPAPWSAVVETYYRLDEAGLHRIGESELAPTPQLPPAKTIPEGCATAVRASGLRTRFGPRHDLAIAQGYSTVITGENGTGKTTLALALAGLTAPREGTVAYSEDIAQGLTKPSHTWSSTHLSQRIGYVFQEPEHQFVTPTVRREIALTGAPAQRVDTLLARLRLEHLVDANPFTLSGGEKRRLSVATALVNAPRLVFLDEPTFGQDDTTFAELVALIRELTEEGITVVSITHDEAFMASLGDAVLALEAVAR